MHGKYTKANKINARAAQYQYKELCTILILPPCLTYTCRNIWWNVMAWRTITPKTSLCVDAGATSAEKGIALTLINVCGEKGRHITAGSSTATTAAQIMSQHCNSCERTSLPNPFSGNDPAALLGVQSTYWDKAQDCSMYHTHATPACHLPLPCWGRRLLQAKKHSPVLTKSISPHSLLPLTAPSAQTDSGTFATTSYLLNHSAV